MKPFRSNGGGLATPELKEDTRKSCLDERIFIRTNSFLLTDINDIIRDGHS